MGSKPALKQRPRPQDNMTSETQSQVTNMQGDLALPRSNGEPLFTAPWESRAFAIAVVLNEGGAYDWIDFQQRLADEIAAAPPDTEGTVYYERWLNSLESLLLDYDMVTQTELDARTAAYKSGEIDDD